MSGLAFPMWGKNATIKVSSWIIPFEVTTLCLRISHFCIFFLEKKKTLLLQGLGLEVGDIIEKLIDSWYYIKKWPYMVIFSSYWQIIAIKNVRPISSDKLNWKHYSKNKKESVSYPRWIWDCLWKQCTKYTQYLPNILDCKRCLFLP